MKLTEKMAQGESDGNAENTNNKGYSNDQLFDIEKVENTPFSLIRQEREWFVAIGKYRLTEALRTREEAEEDAKRIDWDRMMQVMGIMIENYKEGKEEKNGE